jgi:hypothetical protein
VRKAEGKRSRRRWVDDNKMDIIGTEWGDMVWIDVAKGREQWRAPMNTVMNHWIP